MRFRIRFADKLVGVLFIAALLGLVVVIFLLGSHQRWFAKDYRFTAYFDSAVGLSPNMAVQYKGFTIGNIKSIQLTADDRVEAELFIFDNYADRVREGSIVELQVSPIGLGNQFLFYAGLGPNQLEEGAVIPVRSSPEAEDLVRRGLASLPPQGDSISILVSRANTLLETINTVALEVEEAFAGTGETSLGRIVGNAEGTLRDLSGTAVDFSRTAGDVSRVADDVSGTLQTILQDIRPVIANLETLSASLADPNSSVAAVLNVDGEVYSGLIDSLNAVSGTLRNLEKTTAFIPPQLPQVAALIGELREILGTAEDVLIALTNNPLLKNGVPTRSNTQSGGASPRDVSF
jgi:phospholipid/cholesterol/gamma-HCH transport system substrate-binding protein